MSTDFDVPLSRCSTKAVFYEFRRGSSIARDVSISTRVRRVIKIRIFDSNMMMRILLAVAHLLVHFSFFFRHSLGLINRMTSYVTADSYLLTDRATKGNEEKEGYMHTAIDNENK